MIASVRICLTDVIKLAAQSEVAEIFINVLKEGVTKNAILFIRE